MTQARNRALALVAVVAMLAGPAFAAVDSTSAAAATNRQTVTFDGGPAPDALLKNQYPTGVINWGTTTWYLDTAIGKFTTRNIELDGSKKTGSFTLLAPNTVVSLDVLNQAAASTTVSLACAGQPTATVTAPSKAIKTLVTGWTGNCASVTLTVGNTNTYFDNLVIEDAGSTTTTTVPPTTTTTAPPTTTTTAPPTTTTTAPPTTTTTAPPTTTTTAPPTTTTTAPPTTTTTAPPPRPRPCRRPPPPRPCRRPPPRPCRRPPPRP